MTIGNALILGLVQGIAEFLPISSSGHLSVLSNLFNMTTAGGEHVFFEFLLHLGTLIAVCISYWRDMADMFYETLAVINVGPRAGTQRSYPAARLTFMIVISTLPLFFALSVNDYIELLYYKNIFIGFMLFLTGCMLFVSDKMLPGTKTERNMGITDAIIIGLCQCAATIPGLSRSAATITGGIATGLKRDFAVRYSFLMCIPALLGACIISLTKVAQVGIIWSCVPVYLAGMAASILTGLAGVTLVKRVIANKKFGSFAYYCWVMGVLAMILTMIF